MQELTDTLNALRRPRLIVSAARFGLADYNRERTLSRLLRMPTTPTPEAALERLLALEERAEQARQAQAAEYTAARHVEIMIALMGEARLHRRCKPAAAAAAA